MTRTTISVLAALMLGGASAAWAAGADKSSADETKSPARVEQQSSGSGTTSGMSAGQSATGTTSGSTSAGTTAGTTTTMDKDQVEQRLKAQGYTEVSDLEEKGDKFEAKAKKDGDNVNVEIDRKTGMVTEKKS